MLYSPELTSQLAIYRQKLADGTVTLEEMQHAVELMRGERVAALTSSRAGSARRTKARAEIKSADEMMDEMEEL